MLLKHLKIFRHLFAAGLSAIAVSFLLKNHLHPVFSRGAYYIFTALFILWAASAIVTFSPAFGRIRSMIRDHAVGLIVAAVLTFVTALSTTPVLRVLSDEANLLSVSRSMTLYKTVDNITHGYRYYSSFYQERDVRVGVEKHPLSYPYFLHIVHTLLGYDPDNAFIFNHLMFFCALFLAYFLMEGLASKWWRVGGIILIAAQPIVAHTAASGGFDLFFAVFFLLMVWSLRRYLESPSGDRLDFLIATTMIFMNSRQEAPLVAASLGLVAILSIQIHWRSLWNSTSALTAPFLLLPLIWQRLLVSDPFENRHEAAFSINLFLKNNFLLYKSLFRFDFYLPYANLINLLAITGVVIWLGSFVVGGKLWKNRQDITAYHPWVLAALAGLIAEWLVISSYFRGACDHPSNARYYVLFSIILSMAAAGFMSRWSIWKNRSALGMLACSVLFLIYHPTASSNAFTLTQTLPREYLYSSKWLKQNASRNILVISNRPGNYIIQDYGALSVSFANRTRRTILRNLQRHLYEDVYVIQNVEYTTGKPRTEDALDPQFTLKTVASLQNLPTGFIRISKIIKPDPEAAKPIALLEQAVSPPGAQPRGEPSLNNK